jgi:hypothetical protein
VSPSFQFQPTINLPPASATPEPIGKPRPTKWDWVGCRATLESNPGTWVLVFHDFTSGMFSWVRSGKGPSAFNGMGGTLQMSLKNTELIGRTQFGDLWLKWTPADWSTADVERARAAADAGEAVL